MKIRILLASFALLLAQNCFAIYGTTYYYLTVTASAGGQVTSANAGIACKATTCSAQFASGNFQLVASPLAGYNFTGWSGDCSGTGVCNVNMSSDRSVMANFAASGTPPVTPGLVPETGFWWNPAEGGRGYVIEVHDNGNLFIGGFMYDINGNAIWYASGPGVLSNGSYTGEWQQFANGVTLTGAYKPASTTNPTVGTITVQFLTTTTATLTLPDGRQISIVRFPF